MIYKFGAKQVVFTKSVTKTLHSYKQIKKEQHESGGILLGKVYKDLIVVDSISEPSKADKSGRYYFERNVYQAQKIIKKAWSESQGERIYLGEWHTHPEHIPTPSSDDKKLINNMLSESLMEIDFLIMVIVGIESDYVAVMPKEKKRLVQLETLGEKDGLEITLYENHYGRISGFKVSGYLRLAPHGYDIYNAVFSQLFWGTVNSIILLTNPSDYILDETTAFLRFVIPSLQREKNTQVFLLTDSMVIQLQMILQEMEDKNLENIINIKTETLN
ncbi:hypothetical protein CON45_29255 [Priestia megaterium]|uniref:ribosomal-processing cysteine protease Prp n=1 Tax=Priestia megaterium TaxID=1404 RepID=UPI000BEE1EA4|nr:ribosomal-processing cysteine protease Prp [Priestia megaterium]PEA35570.1 hypothetical protein CON45_29255 [Priestia megaterium]